MITLNVDIIDLTAPALSPVRIAVVGKPNPVLNEPVNGEQMLHLIQIPNYRISDSATGIVINGVNIYRFFPDLYPGGGGGGGVTPSQVQQMIDSSLVPVDERIDKVEDDIAHIDASTVAEYTKNTKIPLGRIVYATPGQLYQAVQDFTSNNDPSLTLEEALQADVAAGNLIPVTDSDVASLEQRVSTLEDWKPDVDQDINDLKIAVVAAEEMEYYDSSDEFPTEGTIDITYVDKSDGKMYSWNPDTNEYDLMNANSILDGSIFNSIL